MLQAHEKQEKKPRLCVRCPKSGSRHLRAHFFYANGCANLQLPKREQSKGETESACVSLIKICTNEKREHASEIRAKEKTARARFRNKTKSQKKSSVLKIRRRPNVAYELHTIAGEMG